MGWLLHVFRFYINVFFNYLLVFVSFIHICSSGSFIFTWLLCISPSRNTIMRELAPQFQIPWSIPTEAEDIPIVPTTSGTM